MWEVRLLGPVEIALNDQPVSLGPPKRRAVFAALAVDAGRTVGVTTLIDRVWGLDPPPGVRATLYSHIARIRQAIAGAAAEDETAAVRRRPGGYALDVVPDAVDLLRVRRVTMSARQPPRVDGETRAAMLSDALNLWRGEPLAGIAGGWAENLRYAVNDERIALLVLWAEQEFLLGRYEPVVERSAALLADDPLAEPVAAVLMRALFHAGRPGEALARYAAVRARLAEELGADPGTELRRVHEAILHGGPGRRPPTPTTWTPRRTRLLPAQLPPDIVEFAGRRVELDHLDRIASMAGTRPAAVVISAMSGTAGVGKTALAVHWARQISDRFPDGQLYVNLRGFGPTGVAMTPAEAVRVFLDAFEVPSRRIPASLDAQINMYRSLLADKRVLVLLDNARDAEQVRPLLPGAPGCLVLVTSRAQLTGLVVAEGAQPLDLDLLTTVEARQLLSHRMGAVRMAAEPDAVEEIIAHCARLPLALAIVAARAVSRPAQSLNALMADLRQARATLEPFSVGDPATDVRAVFAWSYRALRPTAAQLFRLLGLHPGPEIGVHAAASLAGAPVTGVRESLDELTDAHLLVRQAPDRYAFHDLLRAYAAELAHRFDSERDRHDALSRLLDHYLHTASDCDRLLSPLRDPIALGPVQPGAAPQTITTYEAAMQWFTSEHAVLTAAIRLAAAAGFDRHVSDLAWVILNFLDRRGHWHDWISTQHLALESAHRSNSPARRATAHRALGRAYIHLHRYSDAELHLEGALDGYAVLGDHLGEGYTHLNVTILLDRQGRHAEALAAAVAAHHLFHRMRHRHGEAHALNAAGWAYAQLGDHSQALSYCERALALHQQVGDRHNVAMTLDSLGYAHHQLGQFDAAIACFQRALDMYRLLDSRYYAAETLLRLADTYDATADVAAARTARERAARILKEIGHANARLPP